MELLTNDEVRKRYLPTRREGYSLLEDYREGRLNKTQRQAVWLFASDLVYERSKKHFGRPQRYGKHTKGRTRNWYEIPQEGKYQDKFDIHSQRIILFLQFLCENPDKTIAALIDAWKRRFSWFEMVRDLEDSGIAVDGDTITEKTYKSNIRHMIKIKRLTREWKQNHNNQIPTVADVLEAWAEELTIPPSRKKIINMSVRIEKFFGIMRRIHAVSWDEINDPSRFDK